MADSTYTSQTALVFGNFSTTILKNILITNFNFYVLIIIDLEIYFVKDTYYLIIFYFEFVAETSRARNNRSGQLHKHNSPELFISVNWVGVGYLFVNSIIN